MSQPQIEALRDNREHRCEMQQLMILGLIQDYPGITSKEISEKSSLPASTVSARINDLESEGLIVNLGPKQYGKRKYSHYQYEPDSVKQAANRQRYHSEAFVKKTRNYLDRFRDKLGDRAVAILEARLNLYAA